MFAEVSYGGGGSGGGDDDVEPLKQSVYPCDEGLEMYKREIKEARYERKF